MTHDPKARTRADDPALAAAARRLGGARLCYASEVIVQPGTRDKWYLESPGFYPVWSDWELIGALLETMPLPSLQRLSDGQWQLVVAGAYAIKPAPLDAVLACCLAMEGET
jgi:hypothetical protein